MNVKKYNIISEIYKKLFLNNPAVDIGTNEENIDLTNTSYDLDFKVSTFQSRGENVYFNVSLYDYRKKEDHPAGYFYIKNYTGEISFIECKILSDIIQAGNELTTEIFNKYA